MLHCWLASFLLIFACWVRKSLCAIETTTTEWERIDRLTPHFLFCFFPVLFFFLGCWCTWSSSYAVASDWRHSVAWWMALVDTARCCTALQFDELGNFFCLVRSILLIVYLVKYSPFMMMWCSSIVPPLEGWPVILHCTDRRARWHCNR